MSDCKQHCDEKRDHKDQHHQDVGDLQQMFDRNDKFRQDIHEPESKKEMPSLDKTQGCGGKQCDEKMKKCGEKECH